jgi:tetratricopeptide (TPR) repeat protein
MVRLLSLCALFAALGLPGLLDARQDAKDKPNQVKVRDDPPVNPDDFVGSTDQQIRQNQALIQKEPRQPIHHVRLAHAYMVKARETGDANYYEPAEAAVTRALELSPRLVPALLQRCTVHSVKHEFRESLQLAQRLYKEHPDEHHCLVVISDMQLELGRIDEAEKALDDVDAKNQGIYVQSRRARLAELRGQTDKAVQLFREAIRDEAYSHVSPLMRAWYHARLGEVLFNAGRLREADEAYAAALKINPKYAVALAGRGRVRAAEGKLPEAVDLLKQAATIYADLATLADLGDLYQKTGQPFLAKLNHDRLEQAAAKQPAAHAREYSLFLANHDRDAARAVELARRDLKTRQDVYAHDTLAWALLKDGKAQEAAEAMREALKLGTRDASLLYHAGMIHARLGENDKARKYLDEAVALNPGFSITQAEVARKKLAELTANRPR